MNLETHLNELPETDACALREIVRRLRGQPDAEPSGGLHDRVIAQLPTRRTSTFSAWLWRSGAIAASLIALLSIASVIRLWLPHERQTVAATEDGIRWLAENQETDGTWAPARHGGIETFRPALTALSLLALHQDAQSYAPQIAKGMSALAELQTTKGTFGGDDSQAQLYNLAITTYVLAACEADPTVVSRAVVSIGASQQPDGSWTYAAAQEGSAAVTAWMTRALETAEAYGIAEANIPLRKGLRWLRGNVRDDGRMAYHPTSEPSETLTALSAYALISAGNLFPDLQQLGIRMTNALHVQPAGVAPTDCYRDYAKIIAFESAGKTANAENVRNQIRQRHPTTAHDQWGVAGGQLYTAALTTLCRAH